MGAFPTASARWASAKLMSQGCGVYRWACLPEAARALRMGEIFEVSGFRNTPRNCPISAQSGKLHLAKVWVAEAVRLFDNSEVVAPARNLQGQWQAPDPTNKRHTQKDKPRPGRRGLKAGRGCRGDAFRPIRLCRWRLRRRRLLVEPPRVATLFKLRDRVVRDGVTLVLGQSFFQTAHDLSGAPEGESDRVPKHFSLGHAQ